MNLISTLKTFLFTTTFLTGSIILAQTGPSGVGSSANNIIWLDANELGLANGATVSSFTDQSGNGNNFSQATSSQRPIYNTGVLNGLPVVTFDGVNDVLRSGSIAALESANLTYFLVFQRATMTSQMLITSNYTSNTKKWRTYCNSNNNKVISAQYSPTINHVNYVDPGAATFVSTHITPTQMRLYRQGNLQMTKNATYTTPSGHQNVAIGNLSVFGPNNYTLNGYLAEVIVYNGTLNSLQRILVENYLGAKYNMAVPTDLYTYESSHNIAMVSIGNDGTNSQTTAEGNSVLRLSGAGGMTAGEYLLCAHDGTSLANFTTTDLPGSLPTHQRWTRTWRAGETGDVGTLTVRFDLSGGNNFGSSTSYRLLVDNITQNGDFTDATVVTGTYNSGDPSISFSVNLNDGDYFTLAGIEQNLVIESVTSGPWSDPFTWDCECVPTANDEVYIMPFNDVTVDANAEVGYFDIEPNGELTMSSDVTLSIYGDWDIIGTLDITDGTIAWVGDSDQYIDAGGESVTFNNMTFNNSGSSTITIFESEYTVNGEVLLTLGDVVLDANVDFIINSTSATEGGSIGEITGGTITGDVTVRRNIPAGLAGWRNLCSPVTDADLSDWDDDLLISGQGFPDGCAYDSEGCFYSVKYTMNSVTNDVTSPTFALTNGRGFEVYMGDNLETFSGVTVDVTGTINSSADVVLNYNTGWHTTGNPYASPASFNTCTISSSVGKYFYVWDPESGQYEWYDRSDNSTSLVGELDNGVVATGQAFWVYASSIGSITWRQSDKVGDDDATYIRSSEVNNSMYLTLSEENSTYRCKIAIEEMEGANDGLDSIQDIRHLSTGLEVAPTLAFHAEDNIRKNYIDNSGLNKSFNLNVILLNDGYYRVSASNVAAFDHYDNVMLYDNVTEEMTNLKTEAEYVFYGDTGEYEDRFVLILSNDEVSEDNPFTAGIDENDESINIVQINNVLNITSDEFYPNATIQVINLLGQQEVYYSNEGLNQGMNTVILPELRGMHLVVINTGDKVFTKKLVF